MKKTVNCVQPLSDDSIDELDRKRFCSRFSLFHGYFQIPMEKKSAERAAFVTTHDLFQPRVIMMELAGAPELQELIEMVKASAGERDYMYIWTTSLRRQTIMKSILVRLLLCWTPSGKPN